MFSTQAGHTKPVFGLRGWHCSHRWMWGATPFEFVDGGG